ncbi:hypothetical protein [Planobispora rosea]|uniref:hypothetical protein n=1 Tax=Planobispora rosea TaxID=35762 RepID=UPI000AD62FB8|nr:hypothetical protein [Planobispora rosea]
MTTVRRVVAVMVITPLVSMSAVLTAASPAQAQARLDMPSRVTSNQAVRISGKVDFAFDAFLYVNGQQVAKGDRNVSYTWNPAVRPNGSYRIKLVQRGKLLGGTWDEASETLVQAAPPATPRGVGARLRGNKAVVTWVRGTEPDLRGYAISTTQGGKVGTVRADRACGGNSCRATLAVPAKAAGRRIGFTVRALRGNGNGGTLVSGGSAVATVNVPAPKAPKSSDSDQGGDTGRNADKNTGTRRSEQNDNRQSDVQDLPRLSPKKSTADPEQSAEPGVVPTKVPELPKEVQGAGAGGSKNGSKSDPKAGPGDGDAPVLGSEPAAAGTDVMPATDTNITARSADSPAGGTTRYGFFIAGGLILLLLGAHGGAWFRRRLLAADTGDSAGTAIVDPGDGTRPPSHDGSASASSPSTVTVRPGTVTISRRPAVILAVAKSRYPEQAPPTFPMSSPAPNASGTDASTLNASGTGAAVPEASGTAYPEGGPVFAEIGGEPPVSPQPPDPPVPAGSGGGPDAMHREDGPAPADSSESGPVLARPADQMVPAGNGGTRRVVSRLAARMAGEIARPVRGQADSGEITGPVRGEADSGARPVPTARPAFTRPVLPAAAPIAEVSVVTPVVVRAGDHQWDGYLPPAPRSMEDSGFWERPQPGAEDFWAADKDGPAS